MPLSGLGNCAVATRRWREGGKHWQAESGNTSGIQETPQCVAGVIDRTRPEVAPDDNWFDQAVAFERDDTEAAVRAYEQAIRDRVTSTRINSDAARERQTGAGRAGIAMRSTQRRGPLRCSISACCSKTWIASPSRNGYEAAVRADPDLADGHYNLAQLFVQLEKPKDALRHMSQYRRLVGGR
jgi:hypothetical protein